MTRPLTPADLLAHPTEIRAELDRRKSKRLRGFVETFWSEIEPQTKLVMGWTLDAICEHLEAVTAGDITRLLINVPPGSMKSLLVNVFWPAWEWGPMGMAHLRYVSFSYAASLTERDNRRFLAIVSSPRYQAAWGDTVRLGKQGETLVDNSSRGWKLATSVGGVATGERGNRVILDDPHSVKDQESETVRTSTTDWFRMAMSNRLNDIKSDAIVVVMQRVHASDVSGVILDGAADYVHLMIPAEYEPERAAPTPIGWQDPRTVEGESFWPDRYPSDILDELATTLGPYAYAGQYQQRPEIKGGGIIRRDEWQLWGNPQDEDDIRYRRYPPFSLVVASFDGALSEKTLADYSAMTVWGIWSDNGHPRAMLIYAWAERLTIHDLVAKIIETGNRYKISRLLVEAKANGLSVSQELRRLQSDAAWGVTLIDPSRQGDKVSRAYAVQHLFAAGVVWAPDRAWADKVITQCAAFPRGDHDDLVDSTTQALRWFRDNNVLTVRAERDAALAASIAAPLTEPPPLYPV